MNTPPTNFLEALNVGFHLFTIIAGIALPFIGLIAIIYVVGCCIDWLFKR